MLEPAQIPSACIEIPKLPSRAIVDFEDTGRVPGEAKINRSHPR